MSHPDALGLWAWAQSVEAPAVPPVVKSPALSVSGFDWFAPFEPSRLDFHVLLEWLREHHACLCDLMGKGAA